LPEEGKEAMRRGHLCIIVVLLCSIASIAGCPEPTPLLDTTYYRCYVTLDVELVYEDDGSPVYSEPVWFTAVKWTTKPRVERDTESEFGPIIKYSNETGSARQEFGYNLGGESELLAEVTATVTIAGRDYSVTEEFYPDVTQNPEDIQRVTKTVTLEIPR
jgi:hypothetical protein